MTSCLLGVGFAEGRLTAGEYGERLSTAYAARSWQQLRQLTADLPPAAGTARRRTATGMATEPDRCPMYLLLIVFPPAVIAWWLLSRRSTAADPPGRLTSASGLALTREPLLPGRAAARCR